MKIAVEAIKQKIFELQNSIFRNILKSKFPPRQRIEMQFLGNRYSGYWFPEIFLHSKGSVWGVGLGHDSSFERKLVEFGYDFCGFEPEFDCYRASSKEFRGLPVVLENYGLWDKSGHFKYTGENISIVNIFKLKESSENYLEIRSLWEVATEKKIKDYSTPRVLKLNIEGAEREILLRMVAEPLEFEILIFQAEFLFHVGIRRIVEKISAFKDLQRILQGLTIQGWEVVDFSRHQITIIKSNYLQEKREQ